MSAYHPDLPHGAGVIMLSVAYHRHFAARIPTERYEEMAQAMGVPLDSRSPVERAESFVAVVQKLISRCGIDGLAMSHFGITREEIPGLARNARQTMGGLFEVDRVKLPHDDTVAILESAYR